ncbi:MAG: DUF2935 domain-containing protein [Oscillospiraceae bacterium]|nr:DUF2935 domain-containing protein [Oscillospiraceae bacterium]
MTQERYAVLSLELHMFFGRIMMEHMLFLEARLMPTNSELPQTAKWYKEQFESVLQNAVMLGGGIVGTEVMSSGEMVTAYTLKSEELTEYFANIGINHDITMMQEKLSGTENPSVTTALISQVSQLNAAVAQLLNRAVELKHQIFLDLQECKVFIADYPLLVRNMINEATDYIKRLTALENGNEYYDAQDVLLFWNQGVLEHVVSYRSMFDPTEKEMIAIADGFIQRYSSLMRETRMMNDMLKPHILAAALKEVIDYRDFSETVAKKVAYCEVQCAMFPLMADHSLREVNYFARLLKKQLDIANHFSQQ